MRDTHPSGVSLMSTRVRNLSLVGALVLLHARSHARTGQNAPIAWIVLMLGSLVPCSVYLDLRSGQTCWPPDPRFGPRRRADMPPEFGIVLTVYAVVGGAIALAALPGP